MSPILRLMLALFQTHQPVELRAQADASMPASNNNLDVAKIYQVVT